MHDPQKWDLTTKELSTLPKELIHDKMKAFEIMLPKQTAQLQKQKAKLFFYINQHYKNGLLNIERKAERFCENFKEFTIKIKVNNQQLGEMQMEISSNFSGNNKKPMQLK